MGEPRQTGLVVLVGAGPGDPGLITCAGADWLRRAEVVCYDRLASPRLLDLCPPSAERIYVGKGPSAHAMGQEEINALLVRRCGEGKLVVRLKGGDPLIFGRGGEEADALRAAGMAYRIVPGVTAAIAAGAYAGIPLTDRRLAATVTFVTGHEDPTKDESNINYAALAGVDTLVFYMGVGNLPAIAERLMANGRSGEDPVAIVAEATTPRQRTLTATLATVAGAAEEAGIRPPALTIVGKVVTLRDRLAWLEKLPLLGRSVLVTRTRKQASRLCIALAELGANVIEAPTIDIAPPEDWAPVDAALRGIAGERGPLKKATGATRPGSVASGSGPLKDPTGATRPGSVASGSGPLKDPTGATRPGSVGSAYGWIVLTSPNGAQALVERMKTLGLDARALAGVRIAAVGPATADVLRRYFIEPDLMPEKFTTEALADALLNKCDVAASRFLLARADIATEPLADRLRSAGAAVEEVTLYRTVRPAAMSEEALTALRERRVDWVTFTSSSTVTNFLALLAGSGVDLAGVKLASIGPVTSDTLRAAGLTPAVEASVHTIDGLVEAIGKGVDV
jgi:uroporphyrinogen III methyltransferase/synthase